MKPFRIDGHRFDKEEVTRIRNRVIELRDAALTANDFDYAVILSYNIGILHQVIQELEE